MPWRIFNVTPRGLGWAAAAPTNASLLARRLLKLLSPSCWPRLLISKLPLSSSPRLVEPSSGASCSSAHDHRLSSTCMFRQTHRATTLGSSVRSASRRVRHQSIASAALLGRQGEYSIPPSGNATRINHSALPTGGLEASLRPCILGNSALKSGEGRR